MGEETNRSKLRERFEGGFGCRRFRPAADGRCVEQEMSA
jgi:hypothetical protein